MTEQILCPHCQHEFCTKCVNRTWKLPIGKGEYHEDVGFQAEEQLACCECSTVNLAKHWPVKKIPKRKDMSHLKQMDFWK